MNEPLFHVVVLRCSIAHAFETFTRRANLWWPLGHRKYDVSTFFCEPKLGGELVEVSHSGERFVWADLTLVDAPNTLEMAWHPGKNTIPTKTKVLFQALGPNETRVQVTHTEGDAALGPDWSKRAVLFNSGWTVVLGAIHTFIEAEREIK